MSERYGNRREGKPDRRVGSRDRRDDKRRSGDRIAAATRAIRAEHEPTYKRIAQGLLVVLLFFETLAVVGLIAYGLHDHAASRKAQVASQRASQASRAASSALHAIRVLVDRQHLLLEQGCQRLNIQRASENRAHLGQYKVDRVVLVFTEAAPVQPRTRRFLRAFLPQLRDAVSEASWTPLTDCVAAVAEHGSAYRAPQPITFARRLPPPSALDARNAALPDPLGSRP